MILSDREVLLAKCTCGTPSPSRIPCKIRLKPRCGKWPTDPSMLFGKASASPSMTFLPTNVYFRTANRDTL